MVSHSPLTFSVVWFYLTLKCSKHQSTLFRNRDRFAATAQYSPIKTSKQASPSILSVWISYPLRAFPFLHSAPLSLIPRSKAFCRCIFQEAKVIHNGPAILTTPLKTPRRTPGWACNIPLWFSEQMDTRAVSLEASTTALVLGHQELASAGIVIGGRIQTAINLRFINPKRPWSALTQWSMGATQIRSSLSTKRLSSLASWMRVQQGGVSFAGFAVRKCGDQMVSSPIQISERVEWSKLTILFNASSHCSNNVRPQVAITSTRVPSFATFEV